MKFESSTRAPPNNNPLKDSFGRSITYLRLSVTDRCDFRCLYCMAEEMTFLPRSEVLSFEELTAVAKAFSELGVKKVRITGGEPLIRRDVIRLFKNLGEIPGISELCLTTNGNQLRKLAKPLHDAGVHRINISLDTLQPERFKQLTRTGNLRRVLDGIDEAARVGFQKIKINSVLMRNHNLDELESLVEFALEKQLDISFIEEMPLGNVQSHQRQQEFVSSSELRQRLTSSYAFTEIPLERNNNNGPAKYWKVSNSSSRIGFISPHSENFCESCNRVRVSAEGQLLLCLGNEHNVDLRKILRQYPGDERRLKAAIINSMAIKPEKHHFDLDNEPQILRFMNATGG